MKLFQYWNTPDPPAEVAAWIEGVRRLNPEFDHVLLNESTAAEFIAAHYGPRETAAFSACAVPAMQADYLRLCLIDVLGGFYLDADFEALSPISELIADAPHAMMLTWGGHVVTGFMMFRKPGNPFIRACLELATDNIETRRLDNVYNCTGPGVVNAIRILVEPEAIDEIIKAYDNPHGREWRVPRLVEVARERTRVTPEMVHAFREIKLMHTLQTARWLGTPKPAYKSTSQHWLHWTGSIFRDPAPATIQSSLNGRP
jgi:hypothetical protein